MCRVTVAVRCPNRSSQTREMLCVSHNHSDRSQNSGSDARRYARLRSRMCLPKAELILEQRRALAQSSHTSVVDSSACASVQMAASTLARTPASGIAAMKARSRGVRAAGNARSKRRSAASAAVRRGPQ